jgi:hypothetical protein
MSHDDEMKSALFLQMSMINHVVHAIGLFARSFDGYLIDRLRSLGTTSFVIYISIGLFLLLRYMHSFLLHLFII